MLARKLCSMFAAAAVGGAVVVASSVSAPLVHASESPGIRQDAHPVSFYLLAGDTDTFDPVVFIAGLPAGTTLKLKEGTAVESLRAEGWRISVTNSLLTVTAPRTAEGNYQIPVILTFPDESTQDSFVTMSVDYLVDIPLSIWLPATFFVRMEESIASLSSATRTSTEG